MATIQASSTVIWKFSASLDWLVRKPLSDLSLFISQMISGTMKPRKMPEMWVIIARVRSSCGALPFCTTSFICLPFSELAAPPWRRQRRQLSWVSVGTVKNGAIRAGSALAGHGHAPDQHRADADVRAPVDVGTHRLDGLEDVLQAAGDGDLVHRVRDGAVLDPEAGRAAGIVAGDGIGALAHQLGHHQALL